MRRRRRANPRRTAAAVGASVLLHGALAALLWSTATGAAPPRPPSVKSYAVNIVSPPPNQLGPPPAEPPMESPGSPAASPQPEPAAPAPRPEVPLPPPPGSEFVNPNAPAPRPAPPKREPAPAPQPTRTPPTPAPSTPAKPANAGQPAATATNRSRSNTPVADTVMRPATRTGARADSAGRRPGLGTSGTGRRPVPATGSNPVASSAGGEGLNVRIGGADFVDRAYLENIIRQVRRHFRPPTDAAGAQAEILFFIERDGTVREMRTVTASGTFRFRSAAREAIEQAGQRGAFGPLPEEFPGDRLPISFYFRPAR